MRNGTRCVRTGEAVRMGRAGGELTVLDGCIWLTRKGDPADHFLVPGQRFALAAGDEAVVEATSRRGALLRWCALPRAWSPLALRERSWTLLRLPQAGSGSRL
jgi:hypothetical protein